MWFLNKQLAVFRAVSHTDHEWIGLVLVYFNEGNELVRRFKS